MARLTVTHPLLEVEERVYVAHAQAGQWAEWSFHTGCWLISQIRPLARPGRRNGIDRFNIGPNAIAGERAIWLRFRPGCVAGSVPSELSQFVKKRRLVDLADWCMQIDMEEDRGRESF